MTLTIQAKRPAVIDRREAQFYQRTVQLLEEYAVSFVLPAAQRPSSLAGSPNGYGLVAVPAAEVVKALPAQALLQLDRALGKLASFRALPTDWDSYGALPVQALAVQRAQELLHTPAFLRLFPAHNARLSVFPRRDGGVQLDIDGGRYAIEVAISAEGEPEFTFFQPDNEVENEFSSLVEAVGWYIAQAA